MRPEKPSRKTVQQGHNLEGASPFLWLGYDSTICPLRVNYLLLAALMPGDIALTPCWGVACLQRWSQQLQLCRRAHRCCLFAKRHGCKVAVGMRWQELMPLNMADHRCGIGPTVRLGVLWRTESRVGVSLLYLVSCCAVETWCCCHSFGRNCSKTLLPIDLHFHPPSTPPTCFRATLGRLEAKEVASVSRQDYFPPLSPHLQTFPCFQGKTGIGISQIFLKTRASHLTGE